MGIRSDVDSAEPDAAVLLLVSVGWVRVCVEVGMIEEEERRAHRASMSAVTGPEGIEGWILRIVEGSL